MIFKYDEAEEQKFYNFCKLDGNPIICTDPVESSSYNGVNLYTSEMGFQQMIEQEYTHFIEYLDHFIQQNSLSNNTYLVTVLKRFKIKYGNLNEQFKTHIIEFNGG